GAGLLCLICQPARRGGEGAGMPRRGGAGPPPPRRRTHRPATGVQLIAVRGLRLTPNSAPVALPSCGLRPAPMLGGLAPHGANRGIRQHWAARRPPSSRLDSRRFAGPPALDEDTVLGDLLVVGEVRIRRTLDSY